MVKVRQRKALGRIATGKGEAIADLMLEVAQFFFRIRAMGQRTGLITSWGGGTFGFMRSLAVIGPGGVHRQSEASAIEIGAPYWQGRCALPRVERAVSGDCFSDGRRTERGRDP